MTHPPTTPTLDPYMQAIADHDLGKHDAYTPPTCPVCNPRGRKTVAGNLDGFYRALLARVVVDQSSSDDEERSPVDGGPMCERCHGFRKLRRELAYDHPDFGKPMPCPDCAHLTAESRLAALFATPTLQRMRHWTLDTFPTNHNPQLINHLEIVREWAADDLGDAWLVLTGAPARGKTGLAVGAMRALIERGWGCAFNTVPDLLDAIRATYGSDEHLSYDELMYALKNVRLLVLDDLGKERLGRDGADSWAAEKLFQLIYARHAAMRRTIITSNKTGKELTARYGSTAITSRIQEAATARYCLQFDEKLPSLRPTNGNGK